MRVARAALVILACLLVLVGALVLVLQSGWAKERLLRLALRQASQYVNGQLTIGRLSGSLVRGVELDQVAITQHGQAVISVDRVVVRYRLRALLSDAPSLRAIELTRPVVHARRDADGWNLARIVKRQAKQEEQRGPGRPLTIDRLAISDGSVLLEGLDSPVREVTGLRATLGFRYRPVQFELRVDDLGFHAAPAGVTVHQLRGKIGLDGDDLHLEGIELRTGETHLRAAGVVSDYAKQPRLNATVRAASLSLPELRRLIPGLPPSALTPALEVKASGPLSRLQLVVEVDSEGGQADGTITLARGVVGQQLAGTLNARNLDLAAVLGNPRLKTDVTGRATFDLAFATGQPYPRGWFRYAGPHVTAFGYEATSVSSQGSLDGRAIRFDARAQAYGARLTGKGRVTLPAGTGSGIAYYVEGEVAGLDMLRLPRMAGAPRLRTDVNGAFGVDGGPQRLEVNVRLRPSMVEGARFGQGTTAHVTLAEEALSYAANGHVIGLDLQRFGRAFDVATLAEDRFRSVLTGDFAVQGSGRALADLALKAKASLVNSELFEARLPTMTVDAKLEAGALQANVEGEFAGLRPAALGYDALVGTILNGATDVRLDLANLAGPISLDSIGVEGGVALSRSTVRDITLDAARVRGSFMHRVARLEEVDVISPVVRVNASGVLALDDGTASDLTYRIVARELEALKDVVGRPIAGVLSVEGRATGTLARLATSGKLAGNRLRYGESVEALTLDSTYTVAMPRLDLSAVAVKADTVAEFLRAGGVDVQRLKASTSYADQRLEVDAQVAAGARSVALGGHVLLHPDHQEIHLARFGIGPPDAVWSLPAGIEATVQYGQQRLAIENLRLERGIQRISVSGSLALAPNSEGVPQPTRDEPGALRIRAEQVQLADLDRLLLSNARLAGQLDADARIRMGVQGLEADATLALRQAQIRGGAFDALDAEINLHQGRMHIDARLQQSAAASLTAKGTIPVSMFGREAPADGGAPIDLRVQSTPIALSLVQGATDAVTDVKGTVLVDVRIGGTTSDPQLEGHVDVSQGAFTLTATNTTYTGLDTRLRFEPDRVVIDDLVLLDDDGDPMSVRGALAVRSRRLGEVDLTISARRFALLNNALGDVDADARLRIGGELRAPRVAGDVTVQSGRLQVDALLRRLETGAYSTTPIAATEPRNTTEPRTSAGASRAGSPPAGSALEESSGEAAGERPSSGPRGETAAPAAPAEAKQGGEGSPLTRATLDVGLHVPDNLVVRARDLRTGATSMNLGNMNMTIGGDIRLQKQPGEAAPTLSGVIEVVRGFYDFQGRRVELVPESRIQFQGLRPINPALDLAAEREVSGVVAQVHIRGRLRNPQLTLSSTPPLDEGDILALIAFGQPINQLGQGERASLTQRAGELAAGFVADPLTGSLEQALDLDYFEIRASGEGGAGPSVALGEQIGENLYVKVRQEFGANEVTQLTLEYRLARFLRLVTSVAEGGTTNRSNYVETRRTENQSVDLVFVWGY